MTLSRQDKCKRGHYLPPTGQCPVCHRNRARERQQRLRTSDPLYSSKRSILWRKKNPGIDRKYDLKRRYGLSLGDFDRMLSDQKYSCGICGTKLESTTACVDHDHESGITRALLCRTCNTGLGHFKDSREIVLAAADYLQRHGQ